MRPRSRSAHQSPTTASSSEASARSSRQSSDMATLRVVAHLRSRPEKIEETRKVLEGLVEPTRAETGCVGYELMQNNDDPTDFTFVEEWMGDDVLDAHLKTDHIQQLVARADELLAAPSDIRRYTLLK